MGNKHFNPASDKITDLWFSVSDASLIFDDLDAYGVLHDALVPVSDVIPKSIDHRQVPHGPAPKKYRMKPHTARRLVRLTG
jgi:hypothetical protein